MPAGKNRKNAKVAMERRRQAVANLYVRGLSQAQIAVQLEVTQPTVCNDLAALRKVWVEDANRDFDAAKAEELRKLGEVERTAWAAWETSKQPTKKQPDDPRPGDPRFLDQVKDCIVTRMRILGLLQPGQTNVSTNVNLLMAGVLATGEEPEPLTMEQRIQAMVQDRLDQQPTEAERLQIEREQLRNELGMEGPTHG